MMRQNLRKINRLLKRRKEEEEANLSMISIYKWMIKIFLRLILTGMMRNQGVLVRSHQIKKLGREQKHPNVNTQTCLMKAWVYVANAIENIKRHMVKELGIASM